MKKQLRTVQPAHSGGSFTVEEAIRAFRKVRGSAPKPGTGFDDEYDGEEATAAGAALKDAGLAAPHARKAG